MPDFIEESLRSWLVKACGVALVLAAVAGWICLLTWSASEPSIHQNGDQTAHNWFGPTGALVADLLFQSLGLVAVLALLPPAVWGYELFSREHLHQLSMRLTVWPLGALALASGLSALPTSSTWPLHQGFGGLVGDILCSLAIQLFETFPIPSQLSGPIIGTSLVLIGLSALSHVMGFKLRDAKILLERAPNKAPKRKLVQSVLKRTMANLCNAVAQAVPKRSVNHPPPANTISPDLQVVTETATKDPAESPVLQVLDVNPRAEGGDTVDEEARRIAERFAPKQDETSTEAPTEDPERRQEPQFAELVVPDKPIDESRAAARHAEGLQLPLGLLKKPRDEQRDGQADQAMLNANVGPLENALANFGVKGKIVNVRPGPVITRYELKPARGVNPSRVMGLADDIARLMSTVSARIAVVPGHKTLGIELPNARRQTVHLRHVFESESFSQSDAMLPLALGVGIDGAPIVADLCAMPHLLMAGNKGSGKSVGLNAIILSILYRLRPEQCRFVMIDSEMLELSIYNGIPHLLSPVITDPKRSASALNWVVREMEERYKQMSRLGVRNLKAFNAKVEAARASGQPLGRTVQTGYDRKTGEAIYEREDLRFEAKPYIVVAIAEMADLMLTAGKHTETAIQRLAQMARAAGIHLITATQRPSVDVITGPIKAGLPTRISFKVATTADSRAVLDQHGAEQLLGAGDMLLAGGGGQFARVHGAFVSEAEIEKVVAFLRSQGEPRYVAGLADELVDPSLV